MEERIARCRVIFSTLVGQCARLFYAQYREHRLDPARMPIASLSMAEEEIRLIGPERCTGHITAATYFGSLQNDSNRHFIELWRQRFGDRRRLTRRERQCPFVCGPLHR